MAAFIGSTCTIAVLSMLDKVRARRYTCHLLVPSATLFPQRPTLIEVVEWIDLDTICLLFGMVSLKLITLTSDSILHTCR